MTAGSCYQLLQLSNGWAQVNTNLGTGWVKANSEWVIVNQNSQQAQIPVPTIIIVPTVQSQPQAIDYCHADPNCGELGYIPTSSGGDADALDIPSLNQFKGECTYHVMSEFIGLYQCWRGMPAAYKWADWARNPQNTPSKRTNCDLSVTPSSPV